MNILTLDFCAIWTPHLIVALNNWNAGFASAGRDIVLVYERREVATTRQYVFGAISVFDCEPQVDDNVAWGEAVMPYGTWEGGWISFLGSATRHDADAIAAHEFGHTLMLNHVPPGTNSVMTEISSLVVPSPSDIANAMPGYPLPPPSPPPPSNHHKKKKKHKGKH